MNQFESTVEQLVASHGVPREKAVARARELYPDDAAAVDAAAIRRANVLEKDEQNECRRIFQAHGCHVYSLSQPRATKQSPGLADLFVFVPRAGVSFWFEAKRPDGGVQSSAQREFQQLCTQCGPRYVIGGTLEAWAVMRELGLSSGEEIRAVQ